VRDHLDREVALVCPPGRIVSLVPSITETAHALRAPLVGRTRFCPALEGVPECGGTKNPDLETVLALAPDLVLANQEENREKDVDELARSVPVFVTDVRTVSGARAWVHELASLLRGETWQGDRGAPVPRPRGRRAATLVWKAPLVLVGEDTYAGDLLRACGLANVVAEPRGRYPRQTLEELAVLKPDLLVLPSEPYPWSPAEAAELERELARLGTVTRSVLVPGESLTWWGARTERAQRELLEAFA
jgi:ABC-type Fe3+-hydroxamate transport system substrate-binding protein